MGRQKPHLSRAFTTCRSSSNKVARHRPYKGSINNRRRRKMATTQHQSQVYPQKHHHWSSSNSMQAAPTWNWLGNLETTLQQVLNTTGNTQHWLSHKTTQANRHILHMGVWARTLWTWQHNNTTGSSKHSWTRQQDHYSNISSLPLEQGQHIQKLDQQSWSTTEQQQHSPSYSRTHQQSAPTSEETWHQCTWLMVAGLPGPMIRRWSDDPMIQSEPMIRRSEDPMVRWSDTMVRWSSDPIIRWSGDCPL